VAERTVTYQRVEVNAKGRRFRITLTPFADGYSCTVDVWEPHFDCWRYLGPANWEHTAHSFTYPPNTGSSGNE